MICRRCGCNRNKTDFSGSHRVCNPCLNDEKILKRLLASDPPPPRWEGWHDLWRVLGLPEVQG